MFVLKWENMDDNLQNAYDTIDLLSERLCVIERIISRKDKTFSVTAELKGWAQEIRKESVDVGNTIRYYADTEM